MDSARIPTKAQLDRLDELWTHTGGSQPPAEFELLAMAMGLDPYKTWEYNRRNDGWLGDIPPTELWRLVDYP